MTKRILVDAVHPEEVRVAVADDTRLIDYEFESTHKKQIKSNIYLGKITRVEPSLQAAFVEYGGNRQGFLPFSEIHYDYYQIPVEDKKKLAQMLEEENDREQEKIDEQEEKAAKSGKVSEENITNDIDKIPAPFSAKDSEDLRRADSLAKEFALEIMGEDYVKENFAAPPVSEEEPEEEALENIDEPTAANSLEFYKKYKIQEVIKRNQVVLIQVVKEERGSKGASLTTYIALAGRYCVFMPNTEKGGGVSRRISSFSERRRIRQIVKSLEMQKGSSIIIRTAGMEKDEGDIKSDYNYLSSMWNNIRKQTLESTAPALIYEESDIVRRSLRDLFKGDVEEVVVEGDEAWKNAENFMEVIAPKQKKALIHHKSYIPIFQKYKIEDRLDELYEPEVKLESGGSIVITPTEALVAIDVNSGKATKERNVEDTAYKTNIEAAKEIARQLRLRDLAGLVVIDFIDMREVRNRKAIERELKDALKSDRAKIQIGRISIFGLLEMSRQRLHSSIVESSSVTCPMCKGIGVTRSEESLALKTLRSIEAHAGKKTVKEINITASRQLVKVLNDTKGGEIKNIEENNSVKVNIVEDPDMLPNQFEVEKPKGSGRKASGSTSNKNPKKDNRDNKDNKGRKSAKKSPKHKKSNDNPDGNINEDFDNSESNKNPDKASVSNIKQAREERKSESSEQGKDDDKASSKLVGLWKKITS
jgi:ribonuclease E